MVVAALVVVPAGVFLWLSSRNQLPVLPTSIRKQLVTWESEHPGYTCHVSQQSSFAAAFSCTHTDGNGNESDIAFVTFFAPDAPASMRHAANQAS